MTTRIFKHANGREVRAQLGQSLWGESFKFAIVIKPWDLIVSSYHWWLRKVKKWEHFHKFIIEIAPMRGFVEFIRSDYGRHRTNECEGNILDWIIIDGNIAVDHVGRFETLERSGHVIYSGIGLEPIPLAKANHVSRRPYENLYTPETRNLVADRLQKKNELFQYRFE